VHVKKEINEISSFKKRYKNKNFNTGINIKFGISALKFCKNYIIENSYLLFLKKKIKIFFKKRKRKDLKIWFFLSKNFPISQKSKNSRMGKGKGIFIRQVIRVPKNKIFLEFSNMNLIFLKKIRTSLKKKNNLLTLIIFKKNLPIFCNNKDISFYNFYKRF
jgi:ribosomal protein L16/L10AE